MTSCISVLIHRLTLHSDGASLVSALWPRGLPQYIRGDYSIQSLQAKNRLVPSHLDNLRDWCYVARDREQQNTPNEYFVAYVNRGAETADVEEVTVRFQGIVKNADLGPYGDWRG